MRNLKSHETITKLHQKTFKGRQHTSCLTTVKQEPLGGIPGLCTDARNAISMSTHIIMLWSCSLNCIKHMPCDIVIIMCSCVSVGLTHTFLLYINFKGKKILAHYMNNYVNAILGSKFTSLTDSCLMTFGCWRTNILFD